MDHSLFVVMLVTHVYFAPIMALVCCDACDTRLLCANHGVCFDGLISIGSVHNGRFRRSKDVRVWQDCVQPIRTERSVGREDQGLIAPHLTKGQILSSTTITIFHYNPLIKDSTSCLALGTYYEEHDNYVMRWSCDHMTITWCKEVLLCGITQ